MEANDRRVPGIIYFRHLIDLSAKTPYAHQEASSLVLAG